MAKKGSLSITSENIFPVIKKWLYSDHDIFYRELISNGCDAITKLKKLELMGEYEKPEEVEYKIQVSVNPTDKTITIEDNGLGMTEEEYFLWVENDFYLKYIISAHEKDININELLKEEYTSKLVARSSSPEEAKKIYNWLKEKGMIE